MELPGFSLLAAASLFTAFLLL